MDNSSMPIHSNSNNNNSTPPLHRHTAVKCRALISQTQMYMDRGLEVIIMPGDIELTYLQEPEGERSCTWKNPTMHLSIGMLR